MLQQGELHVPIPSRWSTGRRGAPDEDVHDFAEDVELQLAVRGIADAHRRGIFIAGQPGRRPFGQPPLAGDTVHDLQLIGTARHRAQ